MKRLAICTFVCAALLGGTAFARTSATDTKDEKSSTQVVCKDGKKMTVDTTRGACNGHGGIDKTASASASTEQSTRSSGASGAAAAGAAGKVWANDSTKVYHCEGDRWYGKTKHGEYMTEAQAKDKGYRPDHGKSCG